MLPERVFEIVASLATFATVYVWLMILLAQVGSRRNMPADEVKSLKFPVPFYPFGQYFAILFIAFTFGIMVWYDNYHLPLAVGVGFLVLMTILYYATGRPKAIAPIDYEELDPRRD